jgi:hypothetical protein
VCAILSAPYFLLIQELRYPLSEVKYLLSAQSLELVRHQLAPDIVRKLDAIKDQEFQNRDLFVKALKNALGREPSPDISRIVLRNACEEEGIEN